MEMVLAKCTFLFLVSLLHSVMTGWTEFPSEKKDVVEGESLKLQCHFLPALVSNKTLYYWIRTDKDGKDNAAIKESALDTHYTVDFNPQEGRYDLHITRAQYNKDNGRFECKLKESGSGADIYNVAFQITVLIQPGPPQITPPNPVAREGEAFALSCMSEGGSPDPTIYWYRGNTRLQGQLQNGGSRDRPTSSVLTIVPRTEDDGATYRCAVWNRAIREEMKMETSVTLRVHYSPRVTVGPYNPLNVMADSDAVLTCSVSANPPVRSVRWVKSGHLLSNTHNHTIPAVTAEDSGQYTCMADNGVGEASRANLNISVLYGPHISLISEKEVSLGDSVSIRCRVASNPAPHILRWVKEGDPSFEQNGDTLRIEGVSSEDTGKYTCQASVSFWPSGLATHRESSSNSSVTINVRHIPGEAKIQLSHPIAVSGRPFTLTCSARPPGWPLPEFRWWREGEDAQISMHANYTITSAHVSDEGQYFCQPQNSLGRGSIASVYLIVHEPAKITLLLQPQIIKKDGDTGFSLTCRARGKPRPRVTWLHNKRELSQDTGRFYVETKSSLENSAYSVQSTLIFRGPHRKGDSLSSADRGRYSCEYENGFGESAVSEMMLRIEHSPIVKHTYNRVAFDLGETAVLQCKVQAYPEPTFQWFFRGRILEDDSNYRTNITDLDDDTFSGVLSIRDLKEDEYGDYTCRAWNKVGDDKKTIIKLMKKNAPDSPSHLEHIDSDADKVTLRWKEGFNGGFANVNFWVNYTNTENGESKVEDCRSQNPCQIIGLHSNTLYHFKVAARNARGFSSYSEGIAVPTKVSLRDMPRATEAHYDNENHYLTFTVEPTPFLLKAKIQARSHGSEEWVQQRTQILQSSEKEVRVYLQPPPEGFSDVRVLLCLYSNDSWCGDAKLASPVEDVLPRTREAQPPISTENLVIIIAIAGVVFLILLIIVICCCWCRKGKKGKKDYEMESSNVRPKAVTGPYYPEGGKTKGMDAGMDGISKPNIYMTNMPDSPGKTNGHLSSPNNGSIMYPHDRDMNPCVGNENHSDLWIKSGGDLPPEGSYHPFDGGLPNSYFYPEDYQPLNEEVMNMKNREHLHAPYYDVSGLPDPYAVGDEEKTQQISLSFDESLESGYSTPSSRSRRVIREIIV